MSRGACLLCLATVALVAAYGEETYEEKAQNWLKQNSKEEFIRSFNSQHKENVKGGRADRLYNHMVSLMELKGARFTDNGVSYTLPVTHYFTFLPDPVADGVEAVMLYGRKAYYKVLELVHDEAIEVQHAAAEWLNESGLLTLMLVLCATYLGVSVLSWFIARFTDGLFPSQRALNQETRRKAEEYLARKRQL